jgi:hypothetical protein
VPTWYDSLTVESSGGQCSSEIPTHFPNLHHHQHLVLGKWVISLTVDLVRNHNTAIVSEVIQLVSLSVFD